MSIRRDVNLNENPQKLEKFGMSKQMKDRNRAVMVSYWAIRRMKELKDI